MVQSVVCFKESLGCGEVDNQQTQQVRSHQATPPKGTALNSMNPCEGSLPRLPYVMRRLHLGSAIRRGRTDGLHGGLNNGQMKGEGRPAVQDTLGLNGASMEFQYPLGNRETQPSSV